MALHYKSKHALPFNKFLDSLQKMFMVFQEEGKPLSECAKVDELLTKVQHPALTAAIAQLRFQLNTKGVTFTVAANHLNSAVSQTPDYQMAHQIKSTNTSQRGTETIALVVMVVDALITVAMVDVAMDMVVVDIPTI